MSLEIDDTEVAIAALTALLPAYESLIFTLNALGNDDDTFTFDLVKSRLLQEEQRSLGRQPKSNKGSASRLLMWVTMVLTVFQNVFLTTVARNVVTCVTQPAIVGLKTRMENVYGTRHLRIG